MYCHDSCDLQEQVKAASAIREDGFAGVSATGTYLVTGGLGGLGLLTAQTLVDMGARSIALVSRSGKVPQGQGLEDYLERLESSQAKIHNLRCDVSDGKQVKELLKKIKEVAPEDPLKGVVHAAGVLDFRELGDQTADHPCH